MEFSYRISEAEYVKAEKPALIRGYSKIFLWGCILLSLVCVWYWFFAPDVRQTNDESQPMHRSVGQDHTNDIFYIKDFPLIAIASSWILSWPAGAFFFFPLHLRSQYRKNPSIQGLFEVNLTPESVSVQIPGETSRTEWNAFDHWRENKGVIRLVFHSGTHYLIILASLVDTQQTELRSILTAHLPKK
jgi:hypothetical protein